MPVDSAERLQFVVKAALNIKLKCCVVDIKAIRRTDACTQDFSAILAVLDLQVRSADQLPRSDSPDVQIVNIRHVRQGQ